MLFKFPIILSSNSFQNHLLFLEFIPVLTCYSKYSTHILFFNIKQQTKYVAIVLGITFTVRVLRDPHHTLMF